MSSQLEFIVEEDFVEYFIFPKLTNDNSDSEKLNNDLQNILKQINEIVDSLSRDYIWHKDQFHLTIRTDSHKILIEENTEHKEILQPHFYGISHYGDNVQDEWFMVYLIFEITRRIPGTIGRVIDSDGEFLLIEAADVLPRWANPDTCEERVFIHNGCVQLVQNSTVNNPACASISAAISEIWLNPTLYKVSDEVQNIINERLKEFNDLKSLSIHNQIIRVPIGVAAILREKPSLISSACRSFCDRDVIDLKACRAMRFFPPENRIRTSVKFTRCLYAMLSHQNYVPDRRVGWELPPIGTEEYKEDILGVKIACGFEILASQAKDDDNIENDRTWKTYLNSLVKKGYFKENIEGSKEYCRLLEESKKFFIENRDRFRTASVVGKDILRLLKELDINSDVLKIEESKLTKSDSDSWLNISSEELETMLTEKYGIKKLYKANGAVNANEFTSNINEFLEKQSDLDGIETVNDPIVPSRKVKKNPSMRKAVDENPITEKSSNEINFEPDAFATHVKNFLDFVIPEDNWDSNSEMSDYEDDDDLEKNIEDMTNTKMSVEAGIKNYMDQMDRELSTTTMGKSFKNIKENQNEKCDQDDDSDDFDDIETFKPIDIDVNTLKNMMDSYKSQIGGPGPTSNLLSAMGAGVSVKDSGTSDLSETQV